MVQVTLRADGVRSDPVVTATFCEALLLAGVPLGTVSPGCHGLSVIVAERLLGPALAALREAFELGHPDGPCVREASDGTAPTVPSLAG